MFRILMIGLAALSLSACQGKAQAPDQSAASKAFMASNAKQPGVVVLPSGLQYKVVKSGPPTGGKPQLNDEVKVQYEGKLINGKVFDSSYERGQPASMPLNRLALDVPAKGAEFDIMIETRDAQHTQEIIDALREAGYPPRPV